MDERTTRQIERINEISRLALTSWIGLLACLTFTLALDAPYPDGHPLDPANN